MIGEGFRAIQSGGIYINGRAERRTEGIVYKDLLIEGRIMVIRHGRSSFRIIEIISDEEEAARRIDLEVI